MGLRPVNQEAVVQALLLIVMIITHVPLIVVTLSMDVSIHQFLTVLPVQMTQFVTDLRLVNQVFVVQALLLIVMTAMRVRLTPAIQ